MVSKRGIEANLEKVRAIINMLEPKNKKDVQRLAGRMVALSQFISKNYDKSHAFFKALQGNKGDQALTRVT